MTSLTTVRSRRPRRWPAAALLLLTPVLGAAQPQDEPDLNPAHIIRTYSAHHSSPLSAVFLQVQQSFLYPITYEEVPYESPTEMVTRDVVAPSGSHLHFQVIPETDFSVTLTKLDATPLLAVQTILAEHRNAGLPGAGGYEALQRDYRIDVVPYQVLGADGAEHRVTPVTSHLISFPKASRYITATLDLIASQMSQASGKKIIIANQPYAAMDQMIDVGASAEVPGDIVETIATQLNTVLSYQLRYDPRLSTYYMSIYLVRDPKIYGNLQNNKAPGTVQSPAANPFFKKDEQH